MFYGEAFVKSEFPESNPAKPESELLPDRVAVALHEHRERVETFAHGVTNLHRPDQARENHADGWLVFAKSSLDKIATEGKIPS